MDHALTKRCCGSPGETQLKREIPSFFFFFYHVQVSLPPRESHEALLPKILHLLTPQPCSGSTALW